MRLFTLLHIESSKPGIHNSFVKSFQDQVALYLNCASKLAESLQLAGIDLHLLTNDVAFIEQLGDYSNKLNITELNFKMDIPDGIMFYSAHYKVEVYKYLSTLQDDYVGIIDADILCINQCPQSFKNIIRNKTPLYYDITTQVFPAFGADRVIADKEMLGKFSSVGLWAGGEFILGPPSFFDNLYAEVSSFKQFYFDHFNSFHHQGDEMLLSVAVEKLRLRGEVILDAGALGLIHRYWGVDTLHKQIPVEGLSDVFMIHLPADKSFIATTRREYILDKTLLARYKKYITNNKFKSVLRHYLKPRRAAL